MIRVFRFACVCVLAALLVPAAAAQESKAAKSTRDKLKQKAAVDAKEQGTKSIFDELLTEAEKPIRFKIDNVSGISNNSKLTFKGTLSELGPNASLVGAASVSADCASSRSFDACTSTPQAGHARMPSGSSVAQPAQRRRSVMKRPGALPACKAP